MTLCKVHRAPFKDGVTRWCKKSNPGDTCEVDESTLPPRRLPTTALYLLGARATEPGWVSFLMQAKANGFGLDQPGDHDLTEERWQEVAELRVVALGMAFDLRDEAEATT